MVVHTYNPSYLEWRRRITVRGLALGKSEYDPIFKTN
jgi:hypothetical protein